MILPATLDRPVGHDPEWFAAAPRKPGSLPLLPPRSRLRVDLTALHLDAIARGKGIGLLPHWLADKREAHHPGELTPVYPTGSQRRYPSRCSMLTVTSHGA